MCDEAVAAVSKVPYTDPPSLRSSGDNLENNASISDDRQFRIWKPITIGTLSCV